MFASNFYEDDVMYRKLLKGYLAEQVPSGFVPHTAELGNGVS